MVITVAAVAAAVVVGAKAVVAEVAVAVGIVPSILARVARPSLALR